MLDRSDAAALLVSHLDWIEQTAHTVASRRGLSADEESDFSGWVKMKLVENDYEIIQKFRGDSKLKTYLAVVVVRLFNNYLRETSGRWRPSATALRLGHIAVRLEKLVHHDGYTLQEAMEVLRSSEADVPEERELTRLFAQLPVRASLRPVEVGIDAVEEAADQNRADATVEEDDTARIISQLRVALDRALSTLTPEDQVIAHLYFSQGLSIGDIARALGLDQKPLYRRVPRLRDELRRRLESEGIGASMIREALAGYADL